MSKARLVPGCVALPLIAALLTASCKPRADTAFDDQAKAKIVREYGLRGEELAVVNLCQKISPGLRLSGQPDYATYCGCMAKYATEDMQDSYKANAIRFADELMRNGVVEGKDVTNYFPVGSYIGQRQDVIASVKTNITNCHGTAKATADRRRLHRS